MSIKVRQLTVLGEFRPFGLTVEEADGKVSEAATSPEKYHYSLFGPEVTRETPSDPLRSSLDLSSDASATSSSEFGEHELFVRGNRIIWSMGTRIYKRYTAESAVLMVRWCRMDSISEPVLCALQADCLSFYTAQGDVFCTPLPYYVASIWPSKIGLLIQKAADVNRATSTSSPPLHRRDISRPSKEHGFSHFKPPVKDDPAMVSSLLVLKHPLEEPQATYFEERGKLCLMKDFEEEVFLATDIDAMPVLYFLFSEQKMLLGIKLHIDKANKEGAIDIKPLTTWSLPAVDASPVLVTRPRVRAGAFLFTDVVILGAENQLFLYSGQHCLCRYMLPVGLGKDFATHGLQPLRGELKIIGVKDSVEGRVNVTCNNGQVFRCALRKFPFSCLVNDCITVMAEGLQCPYYTHFLSLLWGDNSSSYLADSNSHPDQEWESFSSEISKFCNKFVHPPSKRNYPARSQKETTAWDFLLSSRFHAQYRKQSSASLLPILADSSPSAGLYKCNYGREQGVEELSYYMQLGEVLDSLHALYESLKLNILRKMDVEHLASLLCTVSVYLGKTKYIDYYCRDFPEILMELQYNPPPVINEDNALAHLNPPSVFCWLETSLKNGCKSVSNSNNIPTLMCNSKSPVVGWARKVLSFFSLLLGAKRDGATLSSGVNCEIANGSARSREEIMVLAMVAEKFGRQHLDLLPVGVSLPLRHALDICRDSPPLDWPAAAYVLVGREDLARAKLRKEHGSQSSADLVSLSVPYMLHLQPVTVPSSSSEPSWLEVSSSEDPDSLYRNVEDGMEHIFNSSTQLRYGRDLRLNEVRRLLCSSRPVAIQMSINPSASDQEVQQAKLWNLAQRTTALPFGRGAFTLSTTYTLLTEALVIPKLVLAGRLPAQQNATVNLDPNIRNISELSSWPEFHNGVAAGLRLAPFQGKMLRSWIQYNKPEEPSFTHAGLLFAFGLHGHLKVLATTDAYRYLSEEHDVTSAGLLLGLAASNRGTMDPEISKTLNVHIPSRQPEIELPTLLQVAALMGIGLLFEGSAHPLTMKMLLGEIGRRSSGENVLEWEGYAVAAGSALGLVALGRGANAFSFADSFVDQLLLYMGAKGFYMEKTAKRTPPADEQIRNSGQIIDGKQVNFYVTAPGATIALALICLKTESEEIAKRIYIPTTRFDLQYVRPDFIMLRIIARSLIMWSRVQPSREWVEAQVPEFIRVVIFKSQDDTVTGDECELEDVCQAYVNIITGACISLGLKYAGTKNGDVQELLYNYAIYFLNEMKHVYPPSNKLLLPKGLLQQVDRGTVELSMHLIVLSLSLVMAGSGHLQTFRLLRYLRSRSSAEGHMNYGLQMAVSLGIGFLFLGGGMQTFSTSNSAIAALLITLYPRLPTGPNDNRCHLQAFRHLYVIAAESRWVQTVDVDTGLPVYCPLEVTVNETDFYRETTFCEVTPCILPERSVLKSVQVCGPRYWSQFIQLETEDKPWWKAGDKSDPFNEGVLYIKRKVGSCPYADDPVGCQSLLSRAMHKVSGASCSTIGIGNNPQDSSFEVDQLVSTFSADPSLIAFSKLYCDSPGRSCDPNFNEFCLQVLYECVSKDRPALLQVYLFLYTMIEAMWEQVQNRLLVVHDSLFLSNLKASLVALAYGDALLSGRLSCTNGGDIIQPIFIESLRKRIEDILTNSDGIQESLSIYLSKEQWPSGTKRTDAVLLAWYLLWYSIPPPSVVSSALKRILKGKSNDKLSMVPLLRLLLPITHQKGIIEIEKFRISLGR
ncbi:anaphase-promoting complex subunit 1 [Carex littledalei]|uniref:Anaphase-promoting complex subunit 1 n=1 Tax=Carex littledalei TaxID=544730 RepID=A0A833RJF9_9POAL|nr:anaphase-promoting complex subunit 1 [Carex littledalei]